MRLISIFSLKFISILFLVLGCFFSYAPPLTLHYENSNAWVNHVFDSMTVDERLAQLFMIEVRPTYGTQHLAHVEKTIQEHQVGGIIFFKGDPKQQVRLTNKFQELSKTKILLFLIEIIFLHSTVNAIIIVVPVLKVFSDKL